MPTYASRGGGDQGHLSGEAAAPGGGVGHGELMPKKKKKCEQGKRERGGCPHSRVFIHPPGARPGSPSLAPHHPTPAAHHASRGCGRHAAGPAPGRAVRGVRGRRVRFCWLGARGRAAWGCGAGVDPLPLPPSATPGTHCSPSPPPPSRSTGARPLPWAACGTRRSWPVRFVMVKGERAAGGQLRGGRKKKAGAAGGGGGVGGAGGGGRRTPFRPSPARVDSQATPLRKHAASCAARPGRPPARRRRRGVGSTQNGVAPPPPRSHRATIRPHTHALLHPPFPSPFPKRSQAAHAVGDQHSEDHDGHENGGGLQDAGGPGRDGAVARPGRALPPPAGRPAGCVCFAFWAKASR